MTATAELDPAPADAPPTELLSPTARRRLLVGGGYTAVVACLAFLYGVVPGRRSFPLSTVAGIEGWVECLRAAGDPCPFVGYPVSVNLTVSRSVVYGATALRSIGIGVPAGLNLIALACVAAGVAALWYMVHRLTGSHLGAVAAVGIYFVAPLVVSHAGLVTLFIGFALLPVPLALTYLALSLVDLPARAMAVAAGLLVTGLVLIYTDPYPYVVGAVCGACLVIASAAGRVRLRRWRSAAVTAAVMAAVVLPGLIYRVLQSESGLEVQMPPEFYRAMGADIATMFLPTRDQVLGDTLRLPFERWDPHEFYGNYTHLQSVFLGVALLAAAIGGLVVLFRRGYRWLTVGLALASLCCFVFGLGPSLKIADRADRPTFVDPLQEQEDYLMPAELTHGTFPWSGIFEHQPLASMRATYRWHAGVRLTAAVLGGVAVAAVARRRQLLGVGLVALILVESAPITLRERRHVATEQYEQIEQFKHDVRTAFDGNLSEGERVVFMPAANDYLLPIIAAWYRVNAYNMSFDKELERIRPLQPAAVVEAEVAQGRGELTVDQVCRMFREDLVDVVVFTEFDPRWDSYRWPPALRDYYRERYENVGLEGDPAFAIDDNDLAIFVRAAPEGSGGTGRCAPDETG